MEFESAVKLPPIKLIVENHLMNKRPRREHCNDLEIIFSMIGKLATAQSATLNNEETAASFRAIKMRDHDEIGRHGLKRFLKKQDAITKSLRSIPTN